MIGTIHLNKLFCKASHIVYRTAEGCELFFQRLLPTIMRQTRARCPTLPADVRPEQVLAIRQQIEEGTYDIDGRLGEAIDRLLEENLLN